MRKIILQVDYFLKRLVLIACFKGRTSREHLVDDTAKGPEIGGFTGGFFGEEFGGDIFCGADEGVCPGGGVVAGVLWGGVERCAGGGTVREVEEFGSAKVSNFYSHTSVEEDAVVSIGDWRGYFSGFRSRWMTPLLCMYSNASSTVAA